MKEYEVIWKVEFFRIVGARNKDDAKNVVNNIANDFNVHFDIAERSGGNYVEDSFQFIRVIEGVREDDAFIPIE